MKKESLKKLKFIILPMLLLIFTSCSKDDDPKINQDDVLLKMMGLSEAAQTNIYDLNASISAEDLTITQGEDFVLDISIENTSGVDFEKPVYLVLELKYEADGLTDPAKFDAFSFFWCEYNSQNQRILKTINIPANDTYDSSIDVTAVTWDIPWSSLARQNYSFDELFNNGNFDFRLTIFFEDINSDQRYSFIRSNRLNIVME